MKTSTQHKIFSTYCRRVCCALVFILFSIIPLSSQKDALKQANDLFDAARYQEALIYLGRIEKADNSAPILFKRGICYYHTNAIDRALADFKKSVEYGYKNELNDYYIGLIYHQKGQFKEAAEAYKRYILAVPEDDPMRNEVIKLIRQCGYALQIAYQKPLAIIENPGKPVNTTYDEFAWIESPGMDNTFYFNSNRSNSALSMAKGNFEIYQTQSENDLWSKIERLPYPINTRAEEIISSINQSGDALIYYKNDDKSATMVEYSKAKDKANKNTITLPVQLSEENNTVFFYSDHIVLFADQRPEGYGGYDLYISIKKEDKWDTPVNLGSSVNSSFDEMTPYLTNEGHVLYFSSNRPESVGGYDIFRTDFLYESQEWSAPKNMGIPINSPGNDLHFQLGPDGIKGYFSSDRKNAVGGTDIYFARFMERQTGQEFFADFVPFAENPEYLADSAISSKDDVLSKDTKAVNAESIVSKNITELSIPPIFIEGQKELLTEKNITKLKKIIDFMNAHREVSIELFAHSNFGDIIEYNLYSSLKLAEKITEFLAKYGVQKDKVLIKGLGDNYPIVKTVRDGGDPVLSSSYNARIDFKFHDAPDQLSVNYDDGIDVPLLMRDVKYDLFRAISDASLTYKIQIATVNQMYRGMALSLFNDSCIEPDTKTGLYAYTIGLYDTYAKALQTKRELERDGLVNTQVVPYIDGIRLDKDDIVYYVNKYPDLKNYMNYVNVIGSN